MENLEALKALYGHMDNAYDAVAAAHGFTCRGCADNCCETLFFHHTLLEYHFIRQGFSLLEAPAKAFALEKASRVMEKIRQYRPETGPFRGLCPVNVDGKCLIYEHRPMICRLHGLPHSLAGPGGIVKKSPGCMDFERQAGDCGGADSVSLDRTPLYREMARLEKSFREKKGFSGKIRMTVAEILLHETD